MAQQLLSNFTPPGSSSSYKFRAGALFFGTTSGSGTAMTVNIPGVTEYYTGLTLILTMGVQSASGCTLQVNNLDPVPMIYGASQTGTYFTSGATYIFVYDGTNFKGVHSYNSDTTYSALTEADGQAGTATTGRLITAKALKNLINYHAPTKTGTGASGTWGINITGNAATATKFDTATNVTLTGDITGSSSSQKGWNIKTSIGEGKVTNAMLAGSISNDKLANSYFTIKEGSIDHNISLGGQILSKDLATWLGLSKIMSFVGISNDAKLVNGYTGTPTIKEGQTNYTTKTPGDTVLHDTTGKQFIWTGSSWYEIGNGLLYDLQGTAAGLIATLDANDTDGGTNNFVSVVKQTDGKINVTHKALVTTGKWSGEAGSVAWENITNKPGTFTPSEHTHNYSKVSSVTAHSYTPQGSVSAPTITVSKTMANVVNASFDGDILVLTSTSVMTNATASSTAPNFTGTKATLEHTVNQTTVATT